MPSVEFVNNNTVLTLNSTNKLLNFNIVGKTGYTIEAKNCFCGSNIEDDKQFIYITPDRISNNYTSIYSKQLLPVFHQHTVGTRQEVKRICHTVWKTTMDEQRNRE